MSVVRRNVVANIAGKGWAALLSLFLIPFYIHFLGIEAFGLIGFFLSLMAILSVFDLGLGTALNRQLAQYSAQSGKAREMRDLLRTLEAIYWLVGIAIGAAVAALAPVIAAYWIKPQHLSAETVTQALAMMGVAIAFQWPRALYSGGLMGMQRQVAFNLLSSVTGTVNGFGSILVIWLVSPTIQAYIAWYAAASLVDTLLTVLLLWRSLPKSPARPALNLQLLAGIWRFAAGMTGISVMSVVLTQLDKVILVKVIPLDAFGYYSLAWRVAAGLYYLIAPISAAFFPRFSQLLLTGDQQELGRLYHRGCQLMSAVVLPVSVVLAFFSRDFLLAWTHDAAIAANSAAVLALLAVGTALNGLTNLPVTLQFASGRTRLVFSAHAIAVSVMAPLTYFMSLRYGGLGAAWVWLIVNCGYVLILLPIVHRRLLPGHLRRWLVTDVGAPLAAAVLAGGSWKVMTGPPSSYGWMLMNLAVASVLALLAAGLAAPQIRGFVMHRVLGGGRREPGP